AVCCVLRGSTRRAFARRAQDSESRRHTSGGGDFEPRLHVKLYEAVQTAAAKAFEVERHETEAEFAKARRKCGPHGSVGESGKLPGRTLDAGSAHALRCKRA